MLECATRGQIRYDAHSSTHERPKVTAVATPDSAIHAQSTPAEVSVVIVNWNTRKLLRRCLQSLQDDIDTGLCEIIVVDNGSRDGSQAMVEEEFPHVLLIRNAENRGFAAATNQGFSRARTEYVLLLNSDAEVDKEAIGATVDFMERSSDVAVAGCRVIFPDGRPQSSCFRDPSLSAVIANATYLAQLFPKSALLNRDRYGFATWEHVQDVDCVMGSFMMIRRASVIEEPLLDEGYFLYGEEVDLTHRLRANGWRVVYFPGATIVHHHGGSASDPRVAAWVFEAKRRAWLRFLRKWNGVGTAWLANLIMLLGTFPRCLVWSASDAVEGLKSGSLPKRRSLLKSRVSSLGFSRKGVGSAGVVRQ
jgi:GT2 family glycosyltransferase